jgi:hypothetical protein
MLKTTRFRRRPRTKPLTAWDRFIFGCISGLFGALMGLAAAIVLVLALHDITPVGSIVIFSAVYFFGVGLVRGPDAGFLAGDALTAIGVAAAVETGVAINDAPQSDQPNAWGSIWWLVIWLAGIGLLLWRG